MKTMIISNSVKVAALFVQLQCICVAFNLQSRVVKHESFATFQTSSFSSTPAKLGRMATIISMNPDHSLEASSSSPSNSGDKSDGTRREFFNSIMASGIGIMAGASASLANPEPANAQTQSAYIASEMSGGKKLGGLPKKIRNVGNVMVSLLRLCLFHESSLIFNVEDLCSYRKQLHLTKSFKPDILIIMKTIYS
jgi:hypothetical protein